MTKLLFSGLFILSMQSVALAYVSGGGGTGCGGCGFEAMPFDWAGTWKVVLEATVFLAALATIALFLKTFWRRIVAMPLATGGVASMAGVLLLPDSALAWGSSCGACDISAPFDWAAVGQVTLGVFVALGSLATVALAIRAWWPKVMIAEPATFSAVSAISLLFIQDIAFAQDSGCGSCIVPAPFDWAGFGQVLLVASAVVTALACCAQAIRVWRPRVVATSLAALLSSTLAALFLAPDSAQAWADGGYGAGCCGEVGPAIEYAINWVVVTGLVTGLSLAAATAWLAYRTGRLPTRSGVHRFIVRQ